MSVQPFLSGTISYLPSPCPLVRLTAARRLSVAAAACGDGGGSCCQLLLWLWCEAPCYLCYPRPCPGSARQGTEFWTAGEVWQDTELGWTGRASAAGPVLLRPRPCPLSAPGSEEGRSAGERVKKRGRICSLFAQSRRFWWVRFAGWRQGVGWMVRGSEEGGPLKWAKINPALPREMWGNKTTHSTTCTLRSKYTVYS